MRQLPANKKGWKKWSDKEVIEALERYDNRLKLAETEFEWIDTEARERGIQLE